MGPRNGLGHFEGPATELLTQQLAEIVTSRSKAVAFLQIELAAQSGLTHPAAVQDMSKTALDGLTAQPHQAAAGFALLSSSRLVQCLALFLAELVLFASGGIGVSDDDLQTGLLQLSYIG